MTETNNQTLAWCAGTILPLNNLSVSAGDASLEHGLGLFESMRAKSGRVPLLARHMARMTRSAAELGLKLGKEYLPSAQAISELTEKSGLATSSARLRMVLTGGCPAATGQVWVSAHSLGSIDRDNLLLSRHFWPVDERDGLVRHKTLNYWLRRRAFEQATAEGCHESISQDSRGYLWEGSRTALFLVKDEQLVSPPANGPILASIAAEVVRELALEIGISFVSKHLRIDDLMEADEVILTNAVRGILSVGQFCDVSYSSRGPITNALRNGWEKKYF